MDELIRRVSRLPIWSGPVSPQALAGGATNLNFYVEDGDRKYVVRTGDDIPVHRVMRFNESSAAAAAERIGISPPIIYQERGILVMEYVPGRTLGEEDARDRDTLAAMLDLIKRCHHEMEKEIRGPVLAFWPFHAVHDYAHTLKEGNSRMVERLPEFIGYSDQLEKIAGRGLTVPCHNDLVAANFLDTGDGIWLIDWDYAGFGNPLFDLAGLASNNQLGEAEERYLLEYYFESEIPERLHYRFKAMKAISLLREAMWSMVSEIHSGIDFDYENYTAENLDRFHRAWDEMRFF